MKMIQKFRIFTIGLIASISFTTEAQNLITHPSAPVTDPAGVFTNPPESAKPGVWWHWMGSNVTGEGITRDLEALKKAGFGRATIFHLSDMVMPYPAEIEKGPTPEIISWTEPWWKLVRHAAEESKRLGMLLGMHNCPGYNFSGGTWITPELAMQQIIWSSRTVAGKAHVSVKLERPIGDSLAWFTARVNHETGLLERLRIPAIESYYKDIAVLAVPANDVFTINSVINVTDKMQSDGQLDWDAPEGEWTIYRFGHTAWGSVNNPAQLEATGFTCDVLNKEAVNFHIEHVISEIQKHLGDLTGTVFTHVLYDSYEAGIPTWTPRMQEEFLKRRGYDLTPYLVIFAGRSIGSMKDSLLFRNDFDATIKDLYRDVFFPTITEKLCAANLIFEIEPYEGPWRQDEILPLLSLPCHRVLTEFWTEKGAFRPYGTPYEEKVYLALPSTLRKSGQNIIAAEAFSGQPAESKWSETPSWFKPIGDAAFCEGVNFFYAHHFVHQPWDDRFQPGAVFGFWGSHFERTQTWWKPGEAMVKYWHRCQALLQWGKLSEKSTDDFNAVISEGSSQIKYIHRSMGSTDIYFVANTSRNSGRATCSFHVTGMQPELWDPVTGTMRNLPEFEIINDKTFVPLKFDDAQSFFIIFRNNALKTNAAQGSNFPSMKEVLTIKGPWQVTFDSIWGGPHGPVTFKVLEDWTNRSEKGIKYYSGTATYKTGFNVPSGKITGKKAVVYLDLGVVKHIARVLLNDKDLGVVWTAPWTVNLPAGLLKEKGNKLEIQITNVWANRLIGDEQEPADCEWLFPGLYEDSGGYLKEFPDWFLKNQPRPSENRYCFTTWNYFTKDSPLVSSGLLGPVRVVMEE